MIAESVKALRQTFGDSQQKFSNRLGLGMNTVQRWEAGSFKPTPENLVQLYRMAMEAGRTDLASVFAGGRPFVPFLIAGPLTCLRDYLTLAITKITQAEAEKNPTLEQHVALSKELLTILMEADQLLGDVTRELQR